MIIHTYTAAAWYSTRAPGKNSQNKIDLYNSYRAEIWQHLFVYVYIYTAATRALVPDANSQMSARYLMHYVRWLSSCLLRNYKIHTRTTVARCPACASCRISQKSKSVCNKTAERTFEKFTYSHCTMHCTYSWWKKSEKTNVLCNVTVELTFEKWYVYINWYTAAARASAPAAWSAAITSSGKNFQNCTL